MKYIYIIITILTLGLISCEPSIKTIEVFAKSKNAYLTDIKINGTSLSTFSYSVFDYVYKTTDNQITLSAVPADSTAHINYKTGLQTLSPGNNRFDIVVYSEDGTVVQIYIVNILFDDGTLSTLDSIRINGEKLSGFIPDRYEYFFLTEYISYHLEVIPSSPSAIVTIDSPDKTLIDTTTDVIVSFTGVTDKVVISVSNNSKTSVYTIFYALQSINNENNNSESGFYNIQDLSYEMQQDGFTTVITGDSLSVGVGDFVNTGSYPQPHEGLPGYMSWSHMMRDAIWRNDPDFVHADQMLVSSSKAGTTIIKSDYDAASVINSSSEKYTHPFNNRALTITLDDEDDQIFINLTTNTDKIILYFANTPRSDVSCKFKVYLDDSATASDVFINGEATAQPDKFVDLTKGLSTYYMGYDVIAVTLKLPEFKKGSHIITLKDFVKSNVANTDLAFYMLGSGSKFSPVHLTGMGSINTTFYLKKNGSDNQVELTNRITQYKPDLVIMIIGANDACNNFTSKDTLAIIKPDDYKNNLRVIVDRIRSQSPYSHILLMSTPEWSEQQGWTRPGKPRDWLEQYVNAMKEIAIEKNTMFMDMIKFFDYLPDNPPNTIPATRIFRGWNVDFVHFTRYGNTLIARTLLDILMPKGIYDIRLVDAEKTYNTAKTTSPIYPYSTNYFVPQHGYAYCYYNSITNKFDMIYKDSTIPGFAKTFIKEITFNEATSIMNISTFNNHLFDVNRFTVEQFGTVSTEMYARTGTINTFSNQNFYLFKRGIAADGTLIGTPLKPTATDKDDMKFVIRW